MHNYNNIVQLEPGVASSTQSARSTMPLKIRHCGTVCTISDKEYMCTCVWYTTDSRYWELITVYQIAVQGILYMIIDVLNCYFSAS